MKIESNGVKAAGPLLLCRWSLYQSCLLLLSCLHRSLRNESKSKKEVSRDLPEFMLKGHDSHSKDIALKVGNLGLAAHQPEIAMDEIILVLRLDEEASAEKAWFGQRHEKSSNRSQ